MKTSPRPAAAKPVRVLMTTDAQGGVWSYTMELVQGFSRLGMKVALAVMGGRPSRASRADARRIEGLELHESTYKLEWMSDPWGDVDAAGHWLKKLAEQFQPDVVHLNNYCHGDVGFDAPVVMVGHSDVLSWHEAVRHLSAGPEWEEYRLRVRLGLSAARLVVTPTAAMLRNLERHYGSLGSTEVIPNGRSLGILGPAPKEPFVFAAGRLWDEGKNIAALDAAAPRLSWPVYVAGDTTSPAGDGVETHHLQALGRLHPRTVAAWFSRAAIYALPARYEPFGLTALEAALSGCALVLGDIPSLREVWQDAAVYVEPDDSDALARTLHQLIVSEPLRRELAGRALSRARMFAGCRMLAAYTKAYREVLYAGQAAQAGGRPCASAPSRALHRALATQPAGAQPTPAS
jgi:glycogen(starch) synthase